MASILKVDSIGKTSGSTQDTMEGLAKAWYVFDGGRTSGTTSIEDDFNIASVLDNGYR